MNYLKVENLPQHDYQLTGKKYVELCSIGQSIVDEMRALGDRKADLLMMDYFLWDELQIEEDLEEIQAAKAEYAGPSEVDKVDAKTAGFIHDDVKEAIAEIGDLLGFKSRTEVKIAEGAKVDVVWEVSIGNLGRVIYVFEVQTKGSIDSLILNLLRSTHNQAVQAVVAVSDDVQLKKIMGEAGGAPMSALRGKLKCWDYLDVLKVRESLASAFERINRVGLIPEGLVVARTEG